jgi:RimJ/RimL family protein N-acetyltransferase
MICSTKFGHYASPKAETFAGQFITLTPLDVSRDVEALFAGSHAADSVEAMWCYVSAGPFADAGEMAAWLRARQALPDMLLFTVTDRATGRPIGSLSIMSIRPEHGVAELGYIWYEPLAQRTKANTEANYLLLRSCFEELCYRRMEWKCDAENLRSRAAAERLGYTFEGVFRQHQVVKGRNRDTAWFAIIDQEWPRIGAAMRHWLYEDDSVPLGTLLQTEFH